MVYLVGAGAKKKLLTLEAVEILQKAQIILYDALIDEDILEFAKNAKKIFVGKRKDNHHLDQKKINELLIEYGKENIVIRLKGGTPFVFGRGFEEVRALNEAGIEVKIISGVSSINSVTESFMIPLVDREVNDSFRVITGHNIKKFKSIITPYNNRESLTILMGAHKLKEIIKILIDNNYPKELKIALLCKGYTPEAKKILLSLNEILLKDENFFKEIKSLTPLIIFVGEILNEELCIQ